MVMRFLRFYTRNLVVWVVLFGMAAYFWPDPFQFLSQGMKWFFALTMFGIGVVLKPQDFRVFGQKPWLVIIGCCAQYSIMPFGAFLLSKVFQLPPEYAVGLILTGAAPGAMTSNVMSYLAKADAAYSVSLTTASTLICPIMTPGLTYLLAGTAMDVPFADMFIDLMLTVVAPLLAGFALRYAARDRIDVIIDVFPAISATFIVFICCVVIAINRASLPSLAATFSDLNGEPALQAVLVLPIIVITLLCADILLNFYGMAAGYGVGALFRMPVDRRRTLAIEIGMQNAGLGVVLAKQHFGAKATLPAVFFVFLCIITGSLLATYWQRKDARSRQ